MGGLSGWAAWRSRGGPLDAAIALALLAVDLPSGLWAVSGGNAAAPVPPVPLVWSLVSSVLLCAPLLARRRAPRAVAAAVLAAVAFTALTHGPGANSHFAVAVIAIMAATVRVHGDRRDSVVFAAATVVVLVALVPVTGPWFLAFLLYLVVGAVTGEVVAARRSEQSRRHEAEQRDAATGAALRERVRIARDMHDVVTHAVSLMVVQAEGARLAVRRDPDRAEQAMATVAEAGRRTLGELRGLVGALRGPEAAPAAGGEPDTGPVGDLAGLAATMRAAGLAVRLDPDRPRLPAGLHATGYRIVQESLTNCLRHAPAGARVTVGVRSDAAHLRISVVDDGGPARAVPELRDGGSGLAGMRERARAAGGMLDAGPVPSGGWCVEAELPLPVGAL
ncbi:sensor histidine kinase [Pseudonocardia humida]|uniref:histidine kinase n=1 Tax=Pseudonocardia humida TaxID=2800819 RepID=A0ABT1A0U7_9PSEU|nr:sensor histidine kinase [Pseudonocardia humida]MCO1656617.1 sensor histidine kinase [Pseudonocardia humida]